ncbi:Dioxygenase [Planctomycetes bacterium Poly30]|uniref:Dioxygenase n=2 Tax=Saltatorellus ferox TaxID=2528018 RepID=A0A518EL80_9BACT|nr:Dioxygenase [Planctomycetes bacterium Poly30]
MIVLARGAVDGGEDGIRRKTAGQFGNVVSMSEDAPGTRSSVAAEPASEPDGSSASVLLQDEVEESGILDLTVKVHGPSVPKEIAGELFFPERQGQRHDRVRFDLDASGQAKLRLAPGSWVLRLSQLPDFFRNVHIRVGQTSTVEVETSLEGTINGKVTSRDGRPIPGATIAFSAPIVDGSRLPAAEASATGEYELAVEAGDTTVVAYAPGFGASSHNLWIHAGDTETVNLVLDRAGSLQVLVLDSNGKPAAGCVVVAGALDQYSPVRQRFGPDSQVGRTGEDGIVVLEDVCATTTLVEARLEGHQNQTRTLVVDEGAIPSLTMELEASFELSGVVLDHQGNPVNGAQVGVYDEDGEMSEVFSGEDGRFVVTQLRTRTGMGWARHAAKGNARFTYDNNAAESLTEVVLEMSDPVMGEVFDEKRSAVPGAEVSVNFKDEAGHVLPWQWISASGEDGSFSVPNCDPRWIMSMIASAKGYRRVALTCRTTDDVGLLMRSKITDSRVFGRVVDSAGAPVPGALVGLSSVVESNSPASYSGRNGEFSFPRVPRGQFSIIVQDSDHARGIFRGFDAVGGEIDIGDLTVEEGGAVSVQVVATGEDGCSAALASLIDRKGNTCAKFLVADGLGNSGRVPLGEYSLTVTAKGYATSAVDVSVGSTHEVSAEVVLHPGELVQIAAYPPAEMPEHERIRFTLFSSSGEVASFSCRRQSIRPVYTTQFGVGPGDYWVEAEGAGWRGRQSLNLSTLELVNGAKTLEIQLSKDGGR